LQIIPAAGQLQVAPPLFLLIFFLLNQPDAMTVLRETCTVFDQKEKPFERRGVL